MSGKRPLVVLATLLSLVVVLAPISLRAQSATTGLISGVVSDPSGAVVTGAQVTLVQHGTNAEQTTVTDSVGRYVFPAVTPDDYTLKFSATGFAGTVVNDVHVEVLKAYTINMALKVGASTETVTVTEAPTAELQTTDATVGAVLGGEALDALPVFTRSASALMFYQPAVSPGGNIAGARDEQITFSFDGGDVTSDLEGNNTYAAPPGEPSPSPVIPIPIESTQEFQVATTNPNSTFARSSGGQVALLTKAGSNNWHGSAYEYHNDDALNANGWTNDRLKINKPHSVDNRFGGTTGGPIWKNKLFFFANYEGRRLHDDTIFNTVVPTATLKSGIIEFADASGVVRQYSFQPGSITTACGGVSCDPRNIGISPVMKAQLGLYPTGNNPSLGDGLNTTGFTFDAPVPIAQDLGVLRLDYKINAKWSAFVTYHYSNTSRVGTEQFSIVNTAPPSSAALDPIKPQFYTFELTGQLSPSLTSVSHGSFLRDWWGWSRENPTPLESGTQQALEVAGEGAGTSNSTTKLFADPVTLSTQAARSRVFDGHKWYLAQDFSWVKGNHLFQFGGSGYISHDYFLKTDNFAGGLATGPIDYIESTGNGSGEFVTIGSAQEPAVCGTSVTTNCHHVQQPSSLQRALHIAPRSRGPQFAGLDARWQLPTEPAGNAGFLADLDPGSQWLFPGCLARQAVLHADFGSGLASSARSSRSHRQVRRARLRQQQHSGGLQRLLPATRQFLEQRRAAGPGLQPTLRCNASQLPPCSVHRFFACDGLARIRAAHLRRMAGSL